MRIIHYESPLKIFHYKTNLTLKVQLMQSKLCFFTGRGTTNQYVFLFASIKSCKIITPRVKLQTLSYLFVHTYLQCNAIHPTCQGTGKKCRIINVVGLTVLNTIHKQEKGPNTKCRIIRGVGLTVVYTALLSSFITLMGQG